MGPWLDGAARALRGVIVLNMWEGCEPFENSNKSLTNSNGKYLPLLWTLTLALWFSLASGTVARTLLAAW